MVWQTFLITVLLFIAAAIAIAAMQASWQRRTTPGATYFAWMMLAVAIWTLSSAFEYVVDSYPIKIYWSKIQYLGITSLPVFWLLFALDYSQILPRLSVRLRRALYLVGVIPAITLTLAITNERHGLIWSEVAILQSTPRLLVDYHHGAWFWVGAIYSYILLFFGTSALIWGIIHFSQLYRRQSIALIIGALIPWAANFLYLARIRLIPGVDLTPVAFVVAGAIYSLEVFRFQLFDLVPFAQDAVVESMSDGVLVVDEALRIIYLNPAARSILQVDGSDHYSLEKAGLKIGAVIQSALDQNVRRSEIKTDDDPPRYIELQLDPLYRTQGRAAGRLILLRDISLQKQAGEQLRLQSVALSSAPNSIMITDRQGNIQWVNPAFTELTGYRLEEVIGKNPRILKSGKQAPEFYQNLWQTILAGEDWHGELVNRRKDGSLYVEDAMISPVFNEENEITHFVALKQDITARKELEKMRDDLMQAIVHDLRNPLNSILFSMDMIQTLPGVENLPSEILSMVEISRGNAWRMLGMINSMLDLSRLENGNMPLMREPVVLAELVEQTIHSQSLLAQRREILILNDVPYDLPRVFIDRILISRVLQNLVDNAIKFTAQGSNIEITAKTDPENRAVIVSVHDNGPGIPQELKGMLFQKFITGASPRRGSGLGLAFCRLAVEAHHGKIWVESEDHQGTTFLFSLPIEDQEPHTWQSAYEQSSLRQTG
jgi:PAS domain S-box-containing protein